MKALLAIIVLIVLIAGIVCGSYISAHNQMVTLDET